MQKLSKLVSEYDQEYHNHKLQTNNVAPRYRATQQLHDTRKLRNELSLPHQDDCKTSIGHKVMHNKHRTIT